MSGLTRNLKWAGPALRPEALNPALMIAVSGAGRLWQQAARLLPALPGLPVGAATGPHGFGLATQPQTSARPLLDSAGRLLTFNGSDQHLISSLPGHGELREVQIALRLPPPFEAGPEVYQSIFGSRSLSHTQMSHLTLAWRQARYEVWARVGTASLEVTTGIGALMGGQHVLGYSHDGTHIRLWLNGVQIGLAVQTGAAAAARSSFIGALNVGGVGSTPFSGAIAGVLDFPRVLQTGEREQAVAWLRSTLP